MQIKLLIDGGDMKPGPAIAQQLGPLGVNMGKVISDVNSATQEFKGMKVPVNLDINEKTKEFTISTSSPPASELLKKELSLEKGTSDHKNIIMGNASIEDIIKVAKIKHSNMLEKTLKEAVKSILGTSSSMGILVENKIPNDLIQEVNDGKFDNEIDKAKTETSTDKRKKLNDYFNDIKTKQEAKLEADKKAAEEAADAEKTKADKVSEGKTPDAGNTKPAVGSTPVAKPSKVVKK